jgi:hypothetical protein
LTVAAPGGCFDYPYTRSGFDFQEPKMNRILLMLAVMAGLAIVSVAAEEAVPPPPSGRELFDLLRQDEGARTIDDRIRRTKTSMQALLAADRDALFAALDILVTEPPAHDQRQPIMLIRQYALKDADAAAARLETIQNSDTYSIVANAVWGTIKGIMTPSRRILSSPAFRPILFPLAAKE